MLFKSRCYNGGAKHKFEPRYSQDSKPTAFVSKVGEADEGVIESILNASRHVITTYHYDICRWCGKTINKKSGD